MTLLMADPRDDLLWWCAILRGFDPATLTALGAGGPAELVALVAEGALVASAERPDRYSLVGPARRATLARLREQQPRAEVERHAWAFQHYGGSLQRAGADDERAAAEEECLYHLGALHDLFVEYMEWESIISYTSDLRNRGSLTPRVGRWLELCEAYTDIRTGNVVAGCARVEQLLATRELEPQLRLRTLHLGHVAYIYQSRYDRALAMLNAARPLARALGDTARRSYLLLSIGQIYNDLYDHRRALTLSRLSLRLAEASGALYRELHARYEVGSNAMQLGLWDQALAALDAVEAAYRRIGMANRVAMVLWAKGLIYQVNGDHQRCEATFHEALSGARREQSHDGQAISDILAQLGLLAQARGDDLKALAYYEEASVVARRYDIRHWQPIFQARTAAILARLGRPDAAATLWREAVAAVEGLRGAIDAEAIRVGLFGTSQYIYESFVLFLLEQQRPEEAFAYVERARSRAFLDLLARQSGAGSADALALVAGEPPPQLVASTTTLAELQAQLQEDEVVLEYFTTGVRPQGEHWLNRIPEHNRALIDAALPRPTTMLFIITRDQLRVKRIGDRVGATRDGRGQLVDLDANKLQPSALSDDPVLDMLRLDARISWLSKRLLAPASRWIKGRRQIYIIPHGPLHYVPFLALRRPDGSYLLTVGGPAVAFAPSATVLLHSLREAVSSGATANLALGYNGRGRNRLEHAEQEAAAVAGHFGGEAWVGPAPKGASLLGERRALRWLHIAGHALYDRRRGHTGALLLGEGDLLTATTLLSRRDRPCRAELVTLSSCMSGYASISAGDELFGLQRAFLSAVAPTVVCTLARTRDRVSLLVMDQFYARLGAAGARPAVALRDALLAVRAMTRAQVDTALARFGYPALPGGGQPTERPFARPEYWAPFILIGRP